MKIILLGKNGLLGSEIAQMLTNETKYVTFAFSHTELDVTDTKSLLKTIEKIKPSFVINAVGYTKVDKAEEEKDIAMQINGWSVGELAKICGKKDISLMHFSTDYIFEGADKNGYPENAPYETLHEKPLNVYGESKLLGEQLIQKYTKKFFIIRSQWLYGKNGKNFVNTMLNLAKTKPFLQVVNDQFGSPTYVKDLADRIKMLLGYVRDKTGFHPVLSYGIFHLVNEGITSWFEYAKEIFKIAGIKKEIRPISSEEFKSPAKRPKFAVLKNTKQSPMRAWQEALKEYIKEYLKDNHYLASDYERRNLGGRTRKKTVSVLKSHE